MDNPILYQALGGLLTVAILVLIYYCTRSWRWPQILAAFSVYIASWFLIFYTALVYRTLDAWRSLETRTSQQVAELTLERDKLRHGDLEGALDQESIQTLTGKVGRAIIDLGRVWRGCTPVKMQPDQAIVVNTTPAAAPAAPAVPGDAADPAAAPAAPPAPQPNRLQVNQILYVFIEDVPHPVLKLPAGSKVPRYFLGEFRATAVTDTTVTIMANFPLSPVDMAEVARAGRTWSLYETLPVDGHEVFSSNPEEGGKLTESAENESIFGITKEDQALLTLLFPPPTRNLFEAGPLGDEAFRLAEARHRARLEQYQRDGLRAKPTDVPLNVWMKIRFKEPYSEVVDSAAKVSALQLGATDDFYDRGLAEVGMLKLGSKANLKPNDIAVVPGEDGARLLKEKTPDGKPICEEVESVYVRSLQNYAFLLRDMVSRRTRLDTDIMRVQRDLVQTQQTQLHITEQANLANAEQTKLKADLARTTAERDQLTQLQTSLEAAQAELKSELSRLYRENLQLEADFEAASLRRLEELQRQAQSVAGTP